MLEIGANPRFGHCLGNIGVSSQVGQPCFPLVHCQRSRVSHNVDHLPLGKAPYFCMAENRLM